MTAHDLDAILEEIDALAGPEMLRDTDVTVDMLQQRWGISDSAVIARMKRLVDAGQYKALKVYDPAIERARRVWRRVGDTNGGEGGRPTFTGQSWVGD